jgi:hypothetical protein
MTEITAKSMQQQKRFRENFLRVAEEQAVRGEATADSQLQDAGFPTIVPRKLSFTRHGQESKVFKTAWHVQH